MVDIWVILRSYLVPLIVNTLVTITILGFVYIKRIQPLLENAEEVFKNADKVIKTGMSAMGTKSGIVRGDKAMEKAVAGDILASKMPEIKAFLELASPDTLEMFEENPDGLLKIVQKYGHYIGLSLDGAGSTQEASKETDF